MPQHSKILIHWTSPKGIVKRDYGKQTVNNYCKTLIKNGNAEKFITRLKSILKEGIQFNKISEKYWFNKQNVEMPVEEICFTELKLSESSDESPNNVNDRYGYLGIGIHRKYVIENHGNPVFYVENDGLSNLLGYANYIKDKSNDFPDIVNRIDKIISNIKMMGQNGKDHYYKNYDDLEWRIVLDEELKNNIDNRKNNFPPNIVKDNDGKYYLKLKFKLEKVKKKDEFQLEKCIECIIFPHEEILYQSMKFLKDKEFFDNFEYNNMPILTTINRIRHL